jgi:hypothetical protein
MVLPSSAADVAVPCADALYAGVNPASEEALARFDAAYDSFQPDPSLLGGTPARSLAETMAGLVEHLRRIDIDRVTKRQGWWARFTGADLEARLELEVAARSLAEDMRRTAQAAASARHARAAMKADLPNLDAAQEAHQELANATAHFLRKADPADPVVARLHRRLGNLEALHASNRLARAQMELAIDHLGGLLDRFTDIEQLLFPVWQRHALAVAQSAAPTHEHGGVLDQLRSVHARFESTLSAPKDH